MPNTKIYIIDDNETVCHSLSFLLESYYNFKITTYHNPVLFLEEFSLDWTGCLLIDLFMPSLNGIDVMKELIKRSCNMKTIIMSGHAATDIAAQSMIAGAYAFISKPFETNVLLEKINAILHRK